MTNKYLEKIAETVETKKEPSTARRIASGVIGAGLGGLAGRYAGNVFKNRKVRKQTESALNMAFGSAAKK